ncbi:MAG: CerR family C-terminal domain-containing protein [Sphingomonas sp.]|uniref:CerR family C-terminal domain-containing protein n=1 Tax=unclassified Sphingomonas TaxID=196159 RepID=UPI0024567065|nr:MULTISPECIES: CerR family C-terminal domain-containing protein [unclassified Sphingomonas]MBQ1497996.1 CerR family C-terminal domain-containing protein [Sphingomonas sp.]MDH4742572.1 CerR family C-terminal domain-containing protein [Sphingomonas sp. CBMAI 2297]
MTSQTLIETAIDQFGRHGFEGASTREIARASGTAMSSITYHFGGKQGLYLAAADHIAARVREIQGPALEIARETARAGTREQATEALLALLDGFALMMIRPESEAWSLFITREQQAPTEAFDRIYTGVMQEVVGVFVALLGRIRTDLGEREVLAMGIMLFGQTLVLRVCRAAVTRILSVETIDEPTRALLRARLRANALCILSENAA